MFEQRYQKLYGKSSSLLAESPREAFLDLLSEDASKMPWAVGMAGVRMSQGMTPWSTVTL